MQLGKSVHVTVLAGILACMGDAPKQTVYVETTVVSYLASWPSRDLIIAAQQQMTHDWWARRHEYDLRISELVIEEASAGDPGAAADRLRILDNIPLVALSKAADELALTLVRELAIPAIALRDAIHVAAAATNGIEFLVTWNCRHLANLHQRGKIEEICRRSGYNPPLIGTPSELIEDAP
jgi:hypothetical protein